MNRRLALTCAALASTGTAAALADASERTYPGAAGRLAFAVGGANVDIYAVPPGGGAARRLTTDRAFDACPSWSRDGGTIAYCSNATGAFEIWTMRPDGSGKHRETDLRSHAEFPDISPDGRKIVFTDCARTCRIMVVDRATGRESVLVDNRTADDSDPVWSPDGRSIAFVGVAGGTRPQILLARADGRRVRPLTRDRRPKGPFGPDWRPDGRLLVYASAGDVWTVDLRGRARRLTRTRAQEFAPVWSPDGSRIAFVRRGGGRRAVYLMRADGSGARPAAPQLRGPHLAPSWEPRPAG